MLEAIETAYQGTVVAQVHEGDKVADVTVILEEANRREPEEIGSLMLKNAEGLKMPLSELAEVYSDHRTIFHHARWRAEPAGGDLQAGGHGCDLVYRRGKKQIAAKVNFPKGTYAVFSGAAEATAEGAASTAAEFGHCCGRNYYCCWGWSPATGESDC